MPSPKRQALIVDVDQSWPLPDTPSLHPPSLTPSASSSNEHVDQLRPATPTTHAAPAVLLPGFHFSTTDENVDPAEFHRIAAQLLSGESSKRDSAVAGHPLDQNRSRQLHCDLGRDPSGQFGCSCGNSYPAAFRLLEHIATYAGTDQHLCSSCDKLFDKRNRLHRHLFAKHKNNPDTCSGCGDNFPHAYRSKHRSSGLAGCDGILRAAMGPPPEIDRHYRYSTRMPPSQHYWIYDGDMSWQQSSARSARDSKLDDGSSDGVAEQTMGYVQLLLERPALRPNMEACDLCGDLFSKEGDALAQHIGEHSLDFAEKRHRCDDCMICFANEKDLDRHLQSANLNQHCGFTFRHTSRVCHGHHPPTYYKQSIANDHDLMQRHLWAWELSQLRLHRVTVARMLAERLNSPKQRHMSVQDCRLTYGSLLPHVSVANRDSSPSESGWSNDQRESEAAQLDAHFSKILSETLPPEDDLAQRTAVDVRPDSNVIPVQSARDSKHISKSKSLYDLARWKATLPDPMKQRQQRHKPTNSGTISFLKQRASQDLPRPNNLPVAVSPVPSVA